MDLSPIWKLYKKQIQNNPMPERYQVLKPSQNKKGQKNPGAPFSVSFSQLPAVKEKDTKNGAPGIFFGPSYFVMALVFNFFAIF